MITIEDTKLEQFEAAINKEKITEDTLKFNPKDSGSIVFSLNSKSFIISNVDYFYKQNDKFVIVNFPGREKYLYHKLIFTFKNNKDEITEFLEEYNRYSMEHDNIQDFYDKELYKEYGYNLDNDKFVLTKLVKDIHDKQNEPRFFKYVDFKTKRIFRNDLLIDDIYNKSVELLSTINNAIIKDSKDGLYNMVNTGYIPVDLINLKGLDYRKDIVKYLTTNRLESLINYDWISNLIINDDRDVRSVLINISDDYLVGYFNYITTNITDPELVNKFGNMFFEFIDHKYDMTDLAMKLLHKNNLKNLNSKNLDLNWLIGYMNDSLIRGSDKSIFHILFSDDHPFYNQSTYDSEPLFVTDNSFMHTYKKYGKHKIFGAAELKLEIKLMIETYERLLGATPENSFTSDQLKRVLNNFKFYLDNFIISSDFEFDFGDSGVMIIKN